MLIRIAKTAGFCFGVNRAVETVLKLTAEGKKVCTLGPIIHNNQLVDELKQKGVRIINEPSEAKSDEVLVIRSHGVPEATEQQASEFCQSVTDATCPFVSKIADLFSYWAGCPQPTVIRYVYGNGGLGASRPTEVFEVLSL